MNELKATINFTKQTFVINGVDLISGDYNSTKITFNFEDIKNGTKILEIRPKDSEDKNPTFMGEIINNEVILVSKDSENNSISPFTNGGVYLLEVSVYGDDSKLSTITKSINVLSEQIILSDDIVTPYLPIFDELIQEINTAITETNNLNITITKDNGITTVTLTKKDGTTSIVTIKDGVDGVGIESISKISTSGLVDTYRITLTDDSYYDYQVVNGANGTDGRGIASITKTGTSGLVDTYTITYTDGTTSTFEVTNGEDGEVTQEQLDETNRAIDYYKLTLNALPKVTGTGTSLTLNDTAEAPMPMSLSPSELSQDGTPTPETPQDIHTISGDNTITVEGKNLLSSDFTQVSANTIATEINNLHAGTYTLSYTIATAPTQTQVKIKQNNQWVQLKSANNIKSLTFTLDNTYDIRFETWRSGGNDLSNYSNFMLEKGEQVTSPYTPYITPQTLPLNLPLGNVFDINEITENKYIDTSGNLANTQNSNTSNYIKVKANTSYTITWQYTTPLASTSRREVVLYNENKSFVKTIQLFFIDAGNVTFIAEQNGFIRFDYDKKCYDIVMVETGQEANGKLEYCKIDNYEDEFIYNTTDTSLELNKWYLKKNINKVVFDGSENWGVGSRQDGTTKIFILNNFTPRTSITTSQSTTGELCDKFIQKNPYNYVEDAFWIFDNAGSTQLRIGLADTSITTYLEFKEWLSNNITTIYYPLLEPQYILLNDTLQSQLDEIYNWVKAYQDQTNISQVNNDLPFVIKASALKDISNL